MKGDKTMRLIASFMIALIVMMPFPVAEALRILHGATPLVSGSVTDTSATLEWTTDESATTQVDYGATQQLGRTELIADLSTVHLMTLRNLSPYTTYYYQLLSVSQEGDYAIDNNNGKYYSFRTGTAQDTSPPIITNVSIKTLTDTSATIGWVTDEISTSVVYYGKEGQPLSGVVAQPAQVKVHLATIPTAKGSKYRFVAGSCDRDGNCANSTVSGFLAGADISPPFLNVSLPLFYYTNRIDVLGYTEPFATVNVYVNGQINRRLAPDSTGESGVVRILGLALPQQENRVMFEAVDQVGQKSTKEFYVTIDNVPPTLVITHAPEAVVSAQTATVKGRVSESCTIVFEAGLEDTTPPAKVSGLRNTSATENVVELSWNALNVSDFGEYAVYKDNIRIAVTSQARYSDRNLLPGRSYNYRVSAVDSHCNEGEMSDTRQVSVPGTPTISTRYLPELSSVQLTCEKNIDRIESSGDFTKTISLEEGRNKIKITATDRGGHVATYVNYTVYDTTVPAIISHNLAELTPTYIPEVTIRGQASEKAVVMAYVDGELGSTLATDFRIADLFGLGESVTNIVTTDDQGYFTLTIGLNRDNPISAQEETTDMKRGQAWKNQIKLVAVDFAGLQSEPAEQKIFYTMCGGGSHNWAIDMGGLSPGSVFGPDALTPGTLNPRLLMEGMEVISFPVNLTFVGFGTPTIMSKPTLIGYVPNVAEQEDWDNDWIADVNSYWDSTYRQGYIQIPLRPTTETSDDANEAESSISDHREGECGLGGSVGCFKAHLMFEINYKIERPMAPTVVPGQQLSQTAVTETLAQKQCITMMIPIDVPLFEAGELTDWAENMLEGSVDFMNDTVELIDNVLEPLQQIYQVVIVMCLLSMVRLAVNTIAEKIKCGGALINRAMDIAGTVLGGKDGTGDTTFDVNVAKSGMCEQVYTVPGKQLNGKTNCDDPTACQAKLARCTACQKNIDEKYKAESSMQSVCDRVTCPSAPTLQKYIKDAREKYAGKNIPTAFKKFTFEGKDYYPGGEGASCRGFNDTSFATVKQVYTAYTEQKKNDPAESAQKPGNERCSLTHAANESCCGYEYMAKWGTACGIGDDGFSEIGQSVCLAQTAYNQPDSALPEDLKGSCGSLFNRVSGGLCSPSTNTSFEIVNSGYSFKDTDTVIRQRSKDQRIWFAIEPPSGKEGEETNAKVRMCYLAEEYTASGTQVGMSITSKIDCISENAETWDVTDDFSNATGMECSNPSQVKDSKFGKLLGASSGANIADSEYTRICNDIKSKIGKSVGDYVVNPSANIGKSIQCICFGGIIVSLMQIRQIMSGVMGCFNSALTAGGFQSGTCESLLSQYVCDFVIDLIKCFSKKYSSGSGSRVDATTGGTGGFFSAISEAGSEVMSGATGRYGSSPLFNVSSSDSSLSTSICLFAFTGVWDVDMSASGDSTSMLPDTDTLAFFPTCKRRFKSADPVSGYATWTYDLAIAIYPGANINYRTYLKCSQGYTCDSDEGYTSGECDCNRMPSTFTAREYPVAELTGTGEKLVPKDLEVFMEVSGSPVRYDKAVFEYSKVSDTGQTVVTTHECEIKQDSVRPPAYCTFTIPTGFRCGLGFAQQYFAYFNPMSLPKPVFPTTIDAYKLGDEIKFDLDLVQQVPLTGSECGAGLDCEYTRYLTWELRNPRGLVASSPLPTPYATAGQQRFTSSLFRIDSDPEKFRTVAEGAVAAGGPPAGFILTNPSIYSIYFDQLRSSSSSIVHFNVVFNGSRWAIYSPDNARELQPWKNAVEKNGGFETTTVVIKSYDVANTRTCTSIADCFKIAITYNPSAAAGSPQGASNICKAHDTYGTAETWTASFTLWKSMKQGGLWQKSEQVESYNSVQQQYSIPFKVVCNTEVTGAPGTLAGPGASVAGYCSTTSTAKLTQPCWCSAASRAAAQGNIQAPYDCGPRSTIDPTSAKSTYCISGYCSEVPSCAGKPETQPVNESCLCRMDGATPEICTRDSKNACVLSNAQLLGTTGCIDPLCPTGGVQITNANLGKDGTCICVAPSAPEQFTGSECTKSSGDNYCCPTGGCSANYDAECKGTIPTATLSLASSTGLDVNTATYAGAVPATINFNVDWSAVGGVAIKSAAINYGTSGEQDTSLGTTPPASKQVSKQFTSQGTYIVTLKVTNDQNGATTKTQQIIIAPASAAPVAAAPAAPTSPSAPAAAAPSTAQQITLTKEMMDSRVDMELGHYYEISIPTLNSLRFTKVVGQSADDIRFYEAGNYIIGISVNHPEYNIVISPKGEGCTLSNYFNAAPGCQLPRYAQVAGSSETFLEGAHLGFFGSVDPVTLNIKSGDSIADRIIQVEKDTVTPESLNSARGAFNGGIVPPTAGLNIFAFNEGSSRRITISDAHKLSPTKLLEGSSLTVGGVEIRFYSGKDAQNSNVIYYVPNIQSSNPGFDTRDIYMAILPSSPTLSVLQMAATRNFGALTISGMGRIGTGDFRDFGDTISENGIATGKTLLQKFRDAEAGKVSAKLIPNLENRDDSKKILKTALLTKDYSGSGISYTTSQLNGITISSLVAQVQCSRDSSNPCGYRFYKGTANSKPSIIRVDMYDGDAPISIYNEGTAVSVPLLMQYDIMYDIILGGDEFTGTRLGEFGSPTKLIQQIRNAETSAAFNSPYCTLYRDFMPNKVTGIGLDICDSSTWCLTPNYDASCLT